MSSAPGCSPDSKVLAKVLGAASVVLMSLGTGKARHRIAIPSTQLE